MRGWKDRTVRDLDTMVVMCGHVRCHLCICRSCSWYELSVTYGSGEPDPPSAVSAFARS